MKFWIIALLVFALGACAGTTDSVLESETLKVDTSDEIQPNHPSDIEATKAPLSPVPLPNLGQAPELTNRVWINTESTLRLADLRGKVVLLEMWTFG